MNLAVLYADTLFIGRADRGADLFNYVMQSSALALYVVVCIGLWRACRDARLLNRLTGISVVAQMALLLAGVGLIGASSFIPSFSLVSGMAGLFMGCGFALGGLIWLYMISLRELSEIRRGLVLSWLASFVVFALLVAVPSALRLGLLALFALVAGLLALKYALRTLDLDVGSGPLSEARDGMRALSGLEGSSSLQADTRSGPSLGQSLYIVGGIFALAFIFGLSGPVVFEGTGASSGDTQTLLSHLAAIGIASLAASIVVVASAGRVNFLLILQVALTVDVTATVLLPFLGHWYVVVHNTLVETVYRTAQLLALFSCVAVGSRVRFWHVMPVLLVCGGAGLTLGISFGGALYAQMANDSLVLVVVTLAIVYVIFMVVSVALTARALGVRHSGEADDGIADPLFDGRMTGGSIAGLADGRTGETACPADTGGLEAHEGGAQGHDTARLATELATDLFGLSEREASVMEYMARGRGVAFIAEQLVLSPNTVKSYAKTLYKKLGVHSRQELLDLVDELARDKPTEKDLRG